MYNTMHVYTEYVLLWIFFSFFIEHLPTDENIIIMCTHNAAYAHKEPDFFFLLFIFFLIYRVFSSRVARL